MKPPFLKSFGVVSSVHVAVVAVLVFTTFFQACLFRAHKKPDQEFVVDIVPDSDGRPAEPEDLAAIEEQAPRQEPAVEIERKQEPVKVPEKKAEKKPDPPPKPKPPIEVSKKKVVRPVKGPVFHRNPLSAAEINRLIREGARAGGHTVIPGDDQRYKLVVRNVLYENWEPPGKADAGEAVATVRLWFGDGGAIQRWQIERKSGVAALDDSVGRLLDTTRSIPGLSVAFINQYRFRGYTVDFTVQE